MYFCRTSVVNIHAYLRQAGGKVSLGQVPVPVQVKLPVEHSSEACTPGQCSPFDRPVIDVCAAWPTSSPAELCGLPHRAISLCIPPRCVVPAVI